MKKKISGWGRNKFINSNIISLNDEINLDKLEYKNLITRGTGRSYGDSSLYENVLLTEKLNKILDFDDKKGIITCESGIKLYQILEVIIPKGWFLPVSPGTSNISFGGAIASDIHGKNHHKSGTFCEYIDSIKILIGNARVLNLSREENHDLFFATCGGMGLTGIIISAKLKLKKLNSSLIKLKSIKTKNIKQTIEIIKNNNNVEYSVAWLDLLNKSTLGKGIVLLGEHHHGGPLHLKKKRQISIPLFSSLFINNFSMKIFNKLYFFISKNNERFVDLYDYFYPLDKIKNWNILYGNKGFAQYQFVLPEKNIIQNLSYIINKLYKLGHFSYLSVLKQLGDENKNLLSFPKKGFTLAMDFKNNSNLNKDLNSLDCDLIKMGGRIYLTKDSYMSEETFKKTYLNWEKFQQIRKKYSGKIIFKSDQSKRLGIE